VPTADEFRGAARRYRDVAIDADGLRAQLWAVGGEHGVIGGQLEAAVDQSFAASAMNAADLATACEDLAALCDERALVCDEYGAALASYRQRTDSWNERRLDHLASLESDQPLPPPGPAPTEPRRPAPWVEV
jgi:hypothetical protein